MPNDNESVPPETATAKLTGILTALMLTPPRHHLLALVVAATTMACDADPENCLEGFARDKQDRCQPIDTDTGLSSNTPPTAPAISLHPDAPSEQGSPLVCRITSESVDTDGDAVSYAIAWSHNDASTETDTETDVAGDTISGVRLFEGDTWTCTVTPSDGTAEGPSTTATATVGPGFVGWDDQLIPLSEADYTLLGEENGSCFGSALAAAGDLDQDGKMDIIIGDYWWEQPETGDYAGKAYVFLGADLGANPRISAADAAWSFEGEYGQVENDPDCEDTEFPGERCGGDWVGHSVAGGMDGDGDGVDDLLVCAYRSDDGGYDRGKVAFYSGAHLGERGTRSIADADVLIAGEAEGDSMGHSVNWAGDVDGDGIADMVTGSHIHSTSGFSSGRTYLMLSGKLERGEDMTLPDAADYIWDGEDAEDQGGKRNVYAGDIDGDGLADVATVALRSQRNGIGPDITGERRGSGKFYILLSSDILATPSGTVSSVADAAISWMGEEGGDAMGYGVDTMGDFDGDGLDDVSAGSFGHNENGNASGKSYVITASDMPSDGIRDLAEASYSFVGEAENNWSGMDVGPAGDMDRDGLTDLTVGAMGYSSPDKEMVGRAYLFYSQNTDPGSHQLSDADHIFEGEQSWDQAGYRTMGPGDLNGDGMPDLLIGAWQGDSRDGPGKAYILLNP